MNFLTFAERHNKENETFYCFLQLDGNEEALAQLIKIVNRAQGYHIGGHISTFSIDDRITKLSSQTIEEMENAYFPALYSDPIHFCRGKFTPPFDEKEFDLLDIESTALKLDEWFYDMQICNYFTEN